MATIEHPATVRVRRIRYSPLVIGLTLILLLVIVPPVIYLIRSSLHETNFDGSFGAPTLRYYSAIVENNEFLSLALNSALYALGSAVVALTLGGMQAWIVERNSKPKPFNWTAKADTILEKNARARGALQLATAGTK